MNSFHGSSENLAPHALGGCFCNWAIPEKNPNREDLRYTFLKNTGIFRFATLPLEIPE